MADLILVTATQMPVPDRESGLLMTALAQRGIEAAIRPWDREWDWASAALVVCRTPWGYFLEVDAFLGWAHAVATATRLVNPVRTLAWNAHKSYLLDLERAGVPIVPTVLVRSAAPAAERDAALAGDHEVVIKPAVSAGAVGALRARLDRERASCAEHLERLLSAGDALVQPYQPAVAQRGEVSLVAFDGRFSHAVCKRPAPGDYRVQLYHGGDVAAHRPTSEELAVAAAAVAAAPTATSYARIDLVAGRSGPIVMEAELIEPQLFLDADPEAPGRFADCLARRLDL
ncbi:MAG: hypothetical protein ABSH51_16390 [Solirubrobacteraceae bacterium]|jgi:glutathione synthase/RimK-type ligase-like ATP-grasp enzyme